MPPAKRPLMLLINNPCESHRSLYNRKINTTIKLGAPPERPLMLLVTDHCTIESLILLSTRSVLQHINKGITY